MTVLDRANGAERLDRHHRDHLELVVRAEGELAAGHLEAAAAWAQIAGQHAWCNHAGVFASPRLEAVLARLAEGLAPLAPAATPRRDPRDVLHVLTQAYGTGGSTREVECWVQQDSTRRHRIGVTRQGPSQLPPSLGTPASISRLDAGPGGLLRRAARLRRLSAEADVVVLHVHPYDVVPAIAFGAGAGTPPVVLVNHADHVFWLGTTVADVVLHMRDSGRELGATRRGLEPGRSIVCARPLMPRVRSVSRQEAKRSLGIDPEVTVLVTAAHHTKYRPVGSQDFLDLVVPVLERHPDVLLVGAGPLPEGTWADAAERVGGRIRALGQLPDATLVQEAADVYLDSFPFSSLTSLLEASSLGTPSVTFRGHPSECGVLGADVPEVDEHLLRPSDPAAFAELVGRAITDPQWRRDVGERTRRAIAATHLGDGWLAGIDRVYALAGTLEGTPLPGPAPHATGPLDQLVDAVMQRTGYSRGPAGAVSEHLGLLPAAQRLAASRRLASDGALPPVRRMVPEWVLPPLGTWRRRARALARAAG